MKFSWEQISKGNTKISALNGVYAWYYVPKISAEDVKFIEDIISKSDLERNQIVFEAKDFLEKKIFSFYKEDPYNITVRGDLKPVYRGLINHVDQISGSLIEDIVDGKFSFDELRNLLVNIDEKFLSPIYIGMADNIKKRIIQHKEKIVKAKDGLLQHESDDLQSIRDYNFAMRVAQRKYITQFMFVVVQETNGSSRVHNSLENILNRINYPILGRK